MKYDRIIKGRFVDIRSIDVEDAEFSYDIRNMEFARNLVGKQVKDVDSQRKYIEQQLDREGDYYFVILSKSGKKIGLYGIYNIHDNIAEFGREVSIGNSVQAMETKLMMLDFARDVLGIKQVYSVIYTCNVKQLNQQKRFGIEPIGKVRRGDDECFEFLTDIDILIDRNKKLRKLLSQIEGNDSFKE